VKDTPRIDVAPSRSREYLIDGSLGPAEALYSLLAWVGLCAGVCLRLAQYALDRSLCLDEAYLSLNLLHRSFAGLLRPLDYHQGAPLGFLLAEKYAIRLFGPTELSLRLLPLLAGLASMFLFYKVAKDILRPAAVPVAMGLFAIAPPLVYYASEVKQYSTDVAVALVLYSIALPRKPAEWSSVRILVFGLFGSVAIWLSHPSVFVLAGIGTIVIIDAWHRGDVRCLTRFLPAAGMWATSLVVCYLLLLRHLARDQALLDYLNEYFMPLPPRSISDLKWFFDIFFGFFSGTAGLVTTGLAALTFIVGILYKWSKDREQLWLLLTPFFFTLVASGMHKYPLGGRLTLFLLPTVFLLMAEGAEQVRSNLPRNSRTIAYILVGLLMLDPAVYAVHHFAKPHTVVRTPGIMQAEEIRPIFAYVHGHEQPGDLIYLFAEAQPAFEYYEELNHLHDANLVLGTASGNDPSAYALDLDRLRGHRVWVIFSHFKGINADEAKYIRFYLDRLGRESQVYSTPGAAAYLYDLRSLPQTTELSSIDHSYSH